MARPALTEGPYFVDEKLQPLGHPLRSGRRPRAARRAAAAGPARVAPHARRLRAAARRDRGPLALRRGRRVLGRQDPGGATLGKKFLRGYQTTDADGLVALHHDLPRRVPGPRRAHPLQGPAPAGGGQAHEFTSQLFFDDALSDQVYAQPPYAGRGDQRLRNARDGIFRNAGAQLTLAVAPAAPGYAATFELALETG